MTNNISRKDPQLDKLFESVSQDMPDLTSGELLALITMRESHANAEVGQQNSTQLKMRGVVVKSIVILLLAASVYLALTDTTEKILHSGQTLPQNNPSTQLYQGVSRVDDISDAGLHPAEVGDLSMALWAVKTRANGDEDRLQDFLDKPIDIAAYEVMEIGPEQLEALGIRSTDEGELIYYHHEIKVGFPLYDYIHGYNEEDILRDTLARKLGTRPFFAEYATDSRGFMMMHYLIAPAGGPTVMTPDKVRRTWYNWSLGFHDREIKNLEQPEHFQVEHITLFPWVDSINDRRGVGLSIRKGISTLDTTLIVKYNEPQLLKNLEKEVTAKVRRLDSVTKLRYGGPQELAKKYALDLSDSSDALVKRVNSRFNSIKHKGRRELDVIKSKFSAALSMMGSETTIEDKLRLEQLLIKLSYEEYVAAKKNEAAALENTVDLIPVRVRRSSGLKANPKFDNGLILWYRDSDTMRQLLGMKRAMSSKDPKLKLTVMPNPAMLYLYVNYSVEEASPLRLTLADITGKQIYTEVWKAGPGTGKKEINVQQFPNGIYMLLLDSEGGRTTRQIIIQNRP